MTEKKILSLKYELLGWATLIKQKNFGRSVHQANNIAGTCLLAHDQLDYTTDKKAIDTAVKAIKRAKHFCLKEGIIEQEIEKSANPKSFLVHLKKELKHYEKIITREKYGGDLDKGKNIVGMCKVSLEYLDRHEADVEDIKTMLDILHDAKKFCIKKGISYE